MFLRRQLTSPLSGKRCNERLTLFSVSLMHKFSTKPKEKPDIKSPGKIKSYVYSKYFKYIEQLTSKIQAQVQSKYPRVYNVYTLFKGGIYEYVKDAKIFFSVTSDIRGGKHLSTFTRKELEVYCQMPTDMLKSAPVIIAAPLPFIPYLLYPIAYMFPQHLLCRHFWTEDQKVRFSFLSLKSRLPHYPKVLHYLLNKTPRIPDSGLKRVMLDEVLAKISCGEQPELEAILVTKPLFTSRPYGLEHLSSGPRRRIHHWHLARGLDLTVGQRGALQDAKLLYYMDQALVKQSIAALNTPDLRQCCFRRGLNASTLSSEEMKEFLTTWTSLSSKLDYSSLSLLLHAPVLLTYNKPVNKLYYPVDTS